MRKKKRKRPSKVVVYRLVSRTSLFLALLTLLDFLLYISGSYQHFIDSTLSFIMVLCSINALFLVFFSAVGLALSFLLFPIGLRFKYLFFILPYALMVVFGAVIFVAMRVILYITYGI